LSRRRHRDKSYNNHHRLERHLGGTSHYPADNVIRVPVRKHIAYNTLFDVRTPQAIAKALTDTWIPTDWVMIAVPRKKVKKLQQFLKEVM